MVRRISLAPNTSLSLQTTLAADAHLLEGHFLHEESTLNKVRVIYSYFMYRSRTGRRTTSKTGDNLEVR